MKDEQEILNEILNSKFKDKCVALDNFSISETLPIIKNCNLSVFVMIPVSVIYLLH